MAAVVQQRGRVGELHARDPFELGPRPEPVVWSCEPTDVALVLGSRQRLDLVDREACERAGVTVTTRRSGGGAVLVDPERVVWVDAILPHGLAPDDVRGSMLWLGRRAASALTASGHASATLTVHEGGMACGPGSDLVCFAGIGPGEVLDDGRKLVGLSQRRTRHGIRIQAMIHLAPLQHELAGLLSAVLPELDPIGLAAGLDRRAFAEALASEL